MPKIVVEIDWGWPDEPFWLNADNVALALHAYCINTKFQVHQVNTAALDEGGDTGQPPELGDTSFCKMCSKPIEYIGPYWRHTTYSPRHPALPI